MSSDSDSRRFLKFERFNGKNFAIWKDRMFCALDAQDLKKFVTEPIPLAPTEVWKKKNALAKSEIIFHLGDDFVRSAARTEYAKNILDELMAVYERKSLATQIVLRKQLLLMKLGNNSLLSHFSKFEGMMADLKAAGANVQDDDVICHLLLTLPSEYDGVITAIETLTDERITIPFVKNRLLEYEAKLKVNKSNEIPAQALTVTGVNGVNSSEKRKPKGGKKWKKNTKIQHKPYEKKPKSFCRHCGTYRVHKESECFKKPKEDEAKKDGDSKTFHASTGAMCFMVGAECSVNPVPSDVVECVLDSGSTDHIVNDESLLTNVKILNPPKRIQIAKKDEFILATKVGSIQVNTNQSKPAVIEGVLFSKELPGNLLSVKKLTEKGFAVLFTSTKVEILKNGEIILNGMLNKSLFMVNFTLNKLCYLGRGNTKKVNKVDNFKLWHQRLGHISNTKFEEIISHNMFEGLDYENIEINDDLCVPCIQGKQTNLPFNKEKKNKPTRPLNIIHSDVCGPINPPTIDRKNYFVTFIDGYTHYTKTYLITEKSEVFDKFKEYVAQATAHFDLKVNSLYCDNGGEYFSTAFQNFCSEKGIAYHPTIRYTPQLNGVAERMNRTLVQKARAMIHNAKLEQSYWGEAILTATYLINREPTNALGTNKTPFEMWYNKKPNVENLKVFGCRAFAKNPNPAKKFDERTIECIFVGYVPNGYKLKIKNQNKFICERSIEWEEDSFSKTKNSVENQTSENETQRLNSDQGEEEEETESIENECRTSKRIKLQPDWYGERITYQSICNDAFSISLPNNYDEIKTRSDRVAWEKARDSEIASLLENNTWELVTIPSDQNVNIVGSKWVFAVKTDELGNPIRYKMRVVAQGFSQKFGIDYNDTFAPVARISTFRLLVALAVQFDLLLDHMDVTTAFLHGDLKEKIYMKVPPGIPKRSGQVCLLKKSIYGLKQSSRCWYQKFDYILRKLGFKNSYYDPCLYILENSNELVYVILYVDDVLIACKSKQKMNFIKMQLTEHFKMVDLGPVKLFLGIRVNRIGENCISLDQGVYLNSVLKKFNMDQCKPNKIPIEIKLDHIELDKKLEGNKPCQSAIGCLMYAMLCTRPDLCFCVNLLSRYQTKNNLLVWTLIKRVLRYVKGSLDLKLYFKKKDSDKVEILTGYADSSFADDVTTRHSTSGFFFKLFESYPISWSTKRQRCVALSSMEAEYISASEAVREAMWLKNLLHSIKINIDSPITIYEDNQPCISAVRQNDFKRLKHIDIKYHFIKEKSADNSINLKYISTDQQTADVFTKGLPKIRFEQHRMEIGLRVDA